MAGIRVEVRGMAAALSKLDNYSAELRRKIAAEVATTALEIETSAKQLVRVDMGRLRASIVTEFNNDKLGASVGTNLEYAAAQEFGLPGRPNYGYTPYLFPAFEQHKNGFLESIRKIIKDA